MLFLKCSEKLKFWPYNKYNCGDFIISIRDKPWITVPKGTNEYKEGLNRFLHLTMDWNFVEKRIMCPYNKCKFKKWLTRDEVYDQLMHK